MEITRASELEVQSWLVGKKGTHPVAQEQEKRSPIKQPDPNNSWRSVSNIDDALKKKIRGKRKFFEGQARQRDAMAVCGSDNSDNESKIAATSKPRRHPPKDEKPGAAEHLSKSARKRLKRKMKKAACVS